MRTTDIHTYSNCTYSKQNSRILQVYVCIAMLYVFTYSFMTQTKKNNNKRTIIAHMCNWYAYVVEKEQSLSLSLLHIQAKQPYLIYWITHIISYFYIKEDEHAYVILIYIRTWKRTVSYSISLLNVQSKKNTCHYVHHKTRVRFFVTSNILRELTHDHRSYVQLICIRCRKRTSLSPYYVFKRNNRILFIG
jgi:hypothetical protein